MLSKRPVFATLVALGLIGPSAAIAALLGLQLPARSFAVIGALTLMSTLALATAQQVPEVDGRKLLLLRVLTILNLVIALCLGLLIVFLTFFFPGG